MVQVCPAEFESICWMMSWLEVDDSLRIEMFEVAGNALR